ncbi:MAG: hypothetical protein AAGD96_30040, partial [Chloroflexota bacterium]
GTGYQNTQSLTFRSVAIMNRLNSEFALIILGGIWIIFGAVVFLTMILQPQPVTITWSTETEFDTAGFNIFRSESADGEFVQINQQLIPGKAEAAAGAVYTWEDSSAVRGVTYYYKLEDVEYNNTRTLHAPFSHRAQSFSFLKIIMAAFSTILGLGLIIFGVSQVRRKSAPSVSQKSQHIAA